MDPKATAQEVDYKIAGWLAIAAAILTLPTLLFGLLAQPRPPILRLMVFAWVPLAVLQTTFALYALWRFRRLLNERHGFHDVDGLIAALIIGTGIMALAGFAVKIGGTFLVPAPPAPAGLLFALVGIGLMVAVGLPLALIGIVFSVRLLRLQDDLHGLLRPFAITNMVASALLATIILAPVALLVDAVCNVILGVIFLRSAGRPAPVEFV
jgi:hypothetical protein